MLCSFASTASGYVPILFATSPFAAIRSAPTTTASTSPPAISEPAITSATSVHGMPSRSSSQAVRRLPWSTGRVSSTQTHGRRSPRAAERPVTRGHLRAHLLLVLEDASAERSDQHVVASAEPRQLDDH